MKKPILMLLLVLYTMLVSNFQHIYAQEQQTIDSLLNCLEMATEDTVKVDLLNDLSERYQNSNPEKAEDYTKQALNLAENICYKNGIARSLKSIGSIQDDLGNYEKAIEYYQKSLKIFEKIGNKKSISACFNNIGIVYYYLGNIDETIECFEKSLKIEENLGDMKGISGSLVNIGIIYSDQGNYIKAIEYFEKSLKIAENLRDKKLISACLVNIGDIYIKQGDYNNAILYYQKALKIDEELGDKRGISADLNNIGNILNKRGNYSKAMEYYQKALKIREELNDKSGIAECLNNIGNIYQAQGNNSYAIEYYQMSLKIREKIGDKRGVSECLVNIGIVYFFRSIYNKALEYYQKALMIDEELSDKSGISNLYFNIASTYDSQGNYSDAIDYFRKSLKIREELNDKQGISSCLIGMGITYLEQRKYSESYVHLKKAFNYCYEIGAKDEIIQSNYLLGKLCSNQRDYNGALKYYQHALIVNLTKFSDSIIYHNPMKLSAFSKPYLLETLSQKAKALYLLHKEENNIKDIETSIATYELVFRLIYEMRNDYSHESTQLLLSENTKSCFADAIQAAIAYNIAKPVHENDVKAFEYMEKSKSATLGAYLNDLKMKQNWHITDTLLNKEKDIAINRRFYETAIQKAKSEKEGYDTLLVQDYQEKLFNYSRQYDSLITTLKNEYPDYYKLKYEQKVASVVSVQQQLDNNSALINYFVGDSTLFISVVTNNQFACKIVKTDSLFNQKIIDYHIDIKLGLTQKELKGSAYLYQYLISPVEEYIKDKNKLVIIPDGYLYYVPFETLCKNANYSNDLSKIDYLVKSYSVSYHHSATLWLNSLEKTKKQVASNDNFIGFAPVFDSKTNNGYILSREWMPDTTVAEVATRSVSTDFNHFNSLPHSEEEINAIVKLFSKKGKKAEGYLHRKATEENFKQNAQNYSYIHIASHSFANDYYPSLSGIAFSQPDTSAVNENVEDGILYAGETYNLDLPKAELIVLSSCKSGLGKLVKGEGFLSLSRGFLYSGTPNIIFSLWNVKDEQSKDLMVQFYKKVLGGDSYAESLREAKLKLIKNPKTSEPKYWAAWVLVGE